jgi:diacylglycerol kinase (ATP)
VEEVSLIVNPRAGRGRVGKELPKLIEALSEAGTESAVYETEGPGHASELARRAAERGAGVVVAVGGDGTVNEVVNGLVADDHPVGTADLGVVAAGSGADFARSFDLPPHTGAGLRGILGDSSPLDVGKLTFVGPDGETATRYFVNVAEAGMAAATVRLAERFPRWLGRSRYLIAFWPTLARFKPREVTVETDDGSYTGRAHNALLANGRWFGGGMHISPHSDPDDGVADLQINVGPKRQSFTLIPRIFKGKHLPDDRIVQLSGKAGRIDAETPFLVEADGEVLGTTPLGFEMLPGILRVRS